MKKMFLLLFAVVLLPSLFSLSLEIDKKSSDEVMIHEFQNPVTFELDIRNIGDDDEIYFYNLVGFQMSPDYKIPIKNNQLKTIELNISPIGKIDAKGPFTFNYYIRGSDGSDMKKSLTFKIVSLEDAFEIGSENLNINEETLDIYVRNKYNYDFEDIQGSFDSAFFDFERTFSLDAYEKEEFSVDLNQDQLDKLLAGFYTIDGEFEIINETINLEGVIEFSEEDFLKTDEESYGLFIKTDIIRKDNQGNTIADASISVNKNIISRLFTSFNIEPDVVERNGGEVVYIWNKKLDPGEKLEVFVKTNWLLPFIVVLILVLIVVFVKKYSKKDVDLKKRVSFVKAKGGEFALKVSIVVTANSYVEKINIIDKLPPLVKVYHQFGREEPSKINEKARKIEWDFNQLEEGEKRVLSYIVYSKVGVLGKFALPSATAIFEKDGKIKESGSNRAFFVSEQKVPVEEEI
ncbi:MAG: hypothetical protein ACOC1P_04755 [Minisyncoccales bacterium]